ncbi:MAG: hypothetical protein ACOYEV_13830 [Candidatus Nanopelagicales bacterium]
MPNPIDDADQIVLVDVEPVCGQDWDFLRWKVRHAKVLCHQVVLTIEERKQINFTQDV